MPTPSNQILEIINEAFIDNIVKEEVQDHFFRNPFGFDLLLPAVRGEHIDRSGQLVAVNPGQLFTIIQKMDYKVNSMATSRNDPGHNRYRIGDISSSTYSNLAKADIVEEVIYNIKQTGKVDGWMIVVDGLTAWMSNYDLTNIKKTQK